MKKIAIYGQSYSLTAEKEVQLLELFFVIGISQPWKRVGRTAGGDFF